LRLEVAFVARNAKCAMWLDSESPAPTHAAVSHFFDFAEALAPSLNRYALTLKSPPEALDASWITKIALPLPAARSIATRRSTAARVMNPPLCVDR
jgi:hypothetical protein